MPTIPHAQPTTIIAADRSRAGEDTVRTDFAHAPFPGAAGAASTLVQQSDVMWPAQPAVPVLTHVHQGGLASKHAAVWTLPNGPFSTFLMTMQTA